MSTHEFLRPDHGQHQGYYDPNYMQFAQYPYQEPKGAQLPAFGATTHPPTYFTPSMPPQGSMGTDFDFEDEPPLLEELGVNFSHILQKTLNVLNPLRECPIEVLQDTDLAGPLVFCLIFGGTLLLGGKVHFNYIYGFGVLSCLGIYLLLTMMTVDGVAPTCVASVLGYCLLPMCFLSALGIVFSLKSLFGIVLIAFVVLWCAMSSSKLFVRALNMQQQQFLVGYPCALVYAVFALLTVF